MLWIQKPHLNPAGTAVISQGIVYSYEHLQAAAENLALTLLHGQTDLNEAPVAYLIAPGFDYVRAQWGIWLAGGIAVPLCTTHPLPAIQYTLEDTGCKKMIVGPDFRDFVQPLVDEMGIELLLIDEVEPTPLSGLLPSIDITRRAMILYTSGTTSKPKGVVTTHLNISFQIECLVKAWQWSSADHTLCILPLHHVHGIVNVVSCALWSGAVVEFLPSFSAEEVMKRLTQGSINVFMAVPTIYYKLITYLDSLNAENKQAVYQQLNTFRLMVSGSAALPVSVMQKWEELSGQRLLERYGMTEIGMGISNPYRGERRAGTVGQPLPGVKVRLVDEKNQVVSPGTPGEIQVKGANVFKEYWQRPETTREAFTPDGYFKTGDVAVIEDGYYRILGRESQDIIKSGGYKISALEIEEVLRTHAMIKDVSVVGLPDEEWGEVVAAALVLQGPGIQEDQIQHWLRQQLPAYKTPRKYLIVSELPCNTMGKVIKGALKKLFS